MTLGEMKKAVTIAEKIILQAIKRYEKTKNASPLVIQILGETLEKIEYTYVEPANLYFGGDDLRDMEEFYDTADLENL